MNSEKTDFNNPHLKPCLPNAKPRPNWASFYYEVLMRRLNKLIFLNALALIFCLSLTQPSFSQTSTSAQEALTNSTKLENTPAENEPELEPELELENLVPALHAVMDKADIDQKATGAVVLIARDGKIIYRRAIGYIDPVKKSPMLENAIFRLASVSKVYTSMAAAVLLEQGKLDLADPLTKYLPEFNPKLESGKTPVLRVNHLLSHTAGLNYTFFEPQGGPYHQAKVSDGLDISGISLEENLKRIASAPLLFEPGTGWHYSLATDVLGAVVAKANNSTLPEAIDTLVCQPLDMHDTGFKVNAKNRLVVPYYLDGKELRPMPKDLHLPIPGGSSIHFSPGRALAENEYHSGGAGMVGTAPDLLKLLEAMRDGIQPGYDIHDTQGNHATQTTQSNPLLKAQTMLAMNGDQTLQFPPEPGRGFSLGWGIITDPKAAKTPLSLGTIYWSGVYGHNWYIDPLQRTSIVILTNTAFDDSLNKEIINTLYQHLPRLF